MNVFESFSAGTKAEPRINQDTVRIVKQLYGIDMEATQYSKLIGELPPVDGVITMGCNANCPYLLLSFREGRGLDDSSVKVMKSSFAPPGRSRAG